MKLIRRGDMWAVEFRLIDGTRKRLATGVPLTADKAKAEAAAKRIIADQLAANEVDTLAQALDRTYREKWAESKSGGVMRHMVNVLTRGPLGKMRLRDVNYARLKDYCETLKEEGLAPATINRRMSAVGVAMRECARRDECARPDMPHFTETNKRERYMADDEERAVMEWLDRKVASEKFFGDDSWYFVRALSIVLLDTGMRFSEVFKATQRSAALMLHDTKNGKPRSVPLTSRASAAWYGIVNGPHYARLAADPNAWAWVDHRWKQAVAGGGCPDITLHTLRHTCASRLIQRGVDLFTVSKWLGHSSVKVTERYAHLAPESLSNALSALERGPVGVPSTNIGVSDEDSARLRPSAA